MTVNKKRMDAILHGLIEKNLDDFTWTASNFDLRTLYKAEDTIDLMVASKLQNATLAVESASPKTQKWMNKNLDLSKAEVVYNWFLKHDIPIKITLMVGFPTESDEDILETIDFAYKLNPHEIQINIVTPWPGTKLYDFSVKNNYRDGEIKKEDLDHRKAMGFINVPWKYEKLNTMVYDANIHINFLNARDLNNPKHHDRLLNKWLKLAEGLQKHAILLICLGYLYKQMKEFRKSDVYYTKANILYMEEQVQTIYGKYLKYEENPIIQDYKSFVSLYLSKK